MVRWPHQNIYIAEQMLELVNLSSSVLDINLDSFIEAII